MLSKTALVTGGGTGIGRGIALALARRGYNVALVGRRADRLEAVAQEVERIRVRALVVQADLSETGNLGAVIDKVHASFGPVDLLVNNAGTMAGGDLSTLTSERIARGIAANLTAPIELTRLLLPDLVARKGAVILIGSTMSFVPMPSASIYSATKVGIRAFSESLRYELEPLGVHLLVAYPPPTNTDMTRGMSQAAGLPDMPRRNPAVVGEKIVATLMAGRKEVILSRSDHALALLYRLAPWLVRAIFYSQRGRFARMMRRP